MTGIKLETFLDYKYISNLRLSKENNLLAFSISKGDLEENTYKSNIYTYDLKTKDLKQMTSIGSEKSFEFYKDDIIFTSSRTKEEKDLDKDGLTFTNFYKISLHGGEAQKLFSLPLSVSKYEILQDGTWLILGSYTEIQKDLLNIFKLEEDEKKKLLEDLKKKIEEEKDFERFGEIPFWTNGSGYSYGTYDRLFKFNPETEDLKAISPEEIRINVFDLVENKAYIAYTKKKDKEDIFEDLGIINLEDFSLENIFSNEKYFFYSVTELDGEVFAIGTDMSVIGLNSNPRFFTIKDREITDISPEGFDYSIGGTVNSDARLGENKTILKDGKKIYFTLLDGINNHLYSINKKGKLKKEIILDGSIDGFQIGDKDIYTVAFREDRLQEIYKFREDKEERLTNFNDYIYDNYKISTPEHVEITNNKTKLDGFIVRPVNFEQGKKYKTILEIHGGPKTAFGSIFFSEIQYLANLGYVVIYTNPRGSDGKGDEFSDIRGKYGSIDYDDLMYFTKEMVKKYDFIDQERIGVTGGSYGGYMTNWIVGHTDYFKAAVTQRSISNWASFYNITDIGYYFVEDQVQGNPWDDYEKLWDNSPLKYANKVKTPTLVIHSENDFRCDIGQGYQFFSALKYFDVDAEMLIIKGENHNLSRSGRPKSRIKRLEAISDWFERKL